MDGSRGILEAYVVGEKGGATFRSIGVHSEAMVAEAIRHARDGVGLPVGIGVGRGSRFVIGYGN